MVLGFDASRAFNKNRTGTENYSFQILFNLSKIDHVNTYHIYLNPKPHTPNPDLWPSNFKFITIPYPRLWTQFGLAKQTFKDKIDVLFIPAHTLPLVRKPGVKTVVTVHDLGAEYLPETHQLKQRLYLNLMIHHQLKSTTHLIAVSESTKKDLIEKIGIHKEKISVIYEGFNDELFKPLTGQKITEDLGFYNLQPQAYFFFVGTIQPRKNLERLIEAYAMFLKSSHTPSAPLCLAGSKGWLSDEIYDLPKKLGILDNIKFLGFVPDEKLPALYCGAKALLFPSLFEGFGLPILEAMACHCPVLTANISSCPEVAGNAAVLVDPYSVESIFRGILKISDPKFAAKLVSSGDQQIGKFSWEKCARETLQVLENI